MYEQVREQFALFAGLTPEESGRWEVLCRAALGDTLARLRPGTDLEDAENARRLAGAAAASAYYRYCLLRTGEELHSLKLGEITLTAPEESGRLERSIRLREEYNQAAAGLLQPERFCFGRVGAHGHLH